MSETIEDVVKSLRDRAEGRRKSGKLLQIDDKMFDLLADRLEAAHKREREATCEKSSQVGNAAKIREALIKILGIADHLQTRYVLTNLMTKEIMALKQIANTALAEPPRNCDLFGGDPKKLHELWWEWSGDLKNCNADGTVKFTFGEWLLKPAEVKGGEK